MYNSVPASRSAVISGLPAVINSLQPFWIAGQFCSGYTGLLNPMSLMNAAATCSRTLPWFAFSPKRPGTTRWLLAFLKSL